MWQQVFKNKKHEGPGEGGRKRYKRVARNIWMTPNCCSLNCLYKIKCFSYVKTTKQDLDMSFSVVLQRLVFVHLTNLHHKKGSGSTFLAALFTTSRNLLLFANKIKIFNTFSEWIWMIFLHANEGVIFFVDHTIFFEHNLGTAFYM